jgi:hypothetical protein
MSSRSHLLGCFYAHTKEKDGFGEVIDDSQSPQLRKVITLLAQLPEADRVELLKYLISQPINQTALSEILKAVAHCLASGTLSFAKTDATVMTNSKSVEIERNLAFN